MSVEEAFQAARMFTDAEPTPLVREMLPGDPYPVSSLGPLEGIACAVHDKVQAPVAIGAQSALTVASLAVQGFADVDTLASPAPCSLFGLTIAESGERKSSCDRPLLAPVHEFQKELQAHQKDALTRFQIDHAIWETRQRDILKTAKKDPDAARADLVALGGAPEPPLSPVILAGDPTLEGLLKLYTIGRPSLGLFTDEGGGFVGGHAMSKDQRLKSVAGFSKLWDGAGVDRVRSGDGAEAFYGIRLASHILLQPVAAADLLGDPISNGQGFLARFLLCQPESAIGFRLRTGHDPRSDLAISAFGEQVKRHLGADLPLSEGSRNRLAPRILSLSVGARRLLQEYALRIERLQAPDRGLSTVKAFASKSPEQAARIAGVLTLFEDPSASQVAERRMADAVELAQYYLSEAQRLANAALISPDIRDGERLRLWLLESWPEPLISVRAVVRKGPNALREATRAKKLISLLEAHGWLTPLGETAEVDGARSRDVWRIRRKG